MIMPATATLAESLLAPDVHPQVIDDCCALIDREVHEMSGISGAAVKLAHKTVITFMPGHVRTMVDVMLPGLAEKLQPYWDDFNASGGGQFGDYLAKRGPEVAEALLTVSDDLARESERPVIVKAYNTVRGGAAKHVEAALPQVGELVVKYAG
jgi:hypothetical protein